MNGRNRPGHQHIRRFGPGLGLCPLPGGNGNGHRPKPGPNRRMCWCPGPFDGLALAWACARYLAETVRAYALFATHYFELTRLPEQLPGVANVHLDATEHQESIVFLHKVKEGPASKSYSLQVAKLAGIHTEVLQRAQEQLTLLEEGSSTDSLRDISSDSSPVAAPSRRATEVRVQT